jgi:hypothetical protein
VAKRKGESRGPRRVLAHTPIGGERGKTPPKLVHLISRERFDIEYFTLVATAAAAWRVDHGLEPVEGLDNPDAFNCDHVWEAFLYLARTKDTKRFRDTLPDDLGEQGTSSGPRAKK